MSSTATVAATAEEIRRHHLLDQPDGVAGEAIVGVQVPATSANLGPGYDALGLALDIPLVAVARPREDCRVISSGFGGEELPAGDDNLVWRGVLAWCAHAGTQAPDVSIHVRSAIPLERGLGSSSAAAVAGLALGRALTGGTGGAETLLALASDLEGHPDNAAAAIVGGLTLCLADGSFHRVTPADRLRPVLIIPHQRQSTQQARAALPAEVPLPVAAANGARGAAVFAALAGLIALRCEDMSDALHEPARLPLMATSKAVIEQLRGRGIPAALSGAGPSVLAVVARDDSGDIETINAVADGLDAGLEVMATRWDLGGIAVCPP